MKRLISIIALGLFVSTMTYGRTIKVDSKRTIEVDGEIDGYMSVTLAKKLTEFGKTKKPVFIILNSPGGSIAGVFIVQQMRRLRARGIPVVCIAEKMAASMAYVILNACNHRYVFPESLLLWHSASTQVHGKKEAMEDTAENLKILDAMFKQQVIKNMGISSKLYDHYDRADMLFTGMHLMQIAKPGYAKLINDYRKE